MRRYLLVLILVLGACADRIVSPVMPGALEVGTSRRVFVVTNRAETAPGTFGIERSNSLKFLRLNVSVPPDRAPGTISDGRDKPNPIRDFTLAKMTRFDDLETFKATLRTSLNKSAKRELIVYVHGFNNSFADPAFRMAQLSKDLNVDSTMIAFSWPSRGNPLGYQYDMDSAFYSRDMLAKMLKAVGDVGAGRVILIAHSMGSALTMETLRTLELSEPGWSARNISDVLLISPDLNVDLFREQTANFRDWPQPFVVFSSQRDKALLLSGRMRGDNRQLGKLENMSELADLPITFIDVSEFDDGQDHFVAGSSESFIRLVNSTGQLDEDFLAGREKSSVPLLGASRVLGRARSLNLSPLPR